MKHFPLNEFALGLYDFFRELSPSSDQPAFSLCYALGRSTVGPHGLIKQELIYHTFSSPSPPIWWIRKTSRWCFRHLQCTVLPSSIFFWTGITHALWLTGRTTSHFAPWTPSSDSNLALRRKTLVPSSPPFLSMLWCLLDSVGLRWVGLL